MQKARSFRLYWRRDMLNRRHCNIAASLLALKKGYYNRIVTFCNLFFTSNKAQTIIINDPFILLETSWL